MLLQMQPLGRWTLRRDKGGTRTRVHNLTQPHLLQLAQQYGLQRCGAAAVGALPLLSAVLGDVI